MFRALGNIADAFRDEDIPVIALKDVQLAAEVYPDRALRPMGDMDLLIRKQDFVRAANTLTDLGFQRRPSRDMPYTRRYASGLGFWRDSDAVWLDLQWGVAQREWDLHSEGHFTYRVDRMWESAQRFDVDGHELLAPSPDEMLFHLCLHLEGHEYSELILFADIVELLRHVGTDFDWQRFCESVRLHGAQSTVYYVLLISERLFRVTLPDGLLRDLRPPYFQADLFRPVFGNLTDLHLSLDEIRLVASPPQSVLDELEVVVRRQAARARRLFSELDRLACAFVEPGGAPIVFGGTLSPRVFPDPSIPAFARVDALILEDDRPQVEEALRRAGYDFDHSGLRASKRCAITSADPVLEEQPVSLSLRVELTPGLGATLTHEDDWRRSKRRAALRSLARTFSHRRNDDAEAHVLLTVNPLPPEHLAATLLARAGERDSGRLFGLCSVLEFFRHCPRRLDPDRLAEVTRHTGRESSATSAAKIADALAALEEPAALDGLVQTGPPARVLEFARYDSSWLGGRPALRDAYYFLFSLLALDGVKAKARFFAWALLVPHRGFPVVPRLTLRLAGHLFTSLRRRRPEVTDLSYWARPTPDEPTVDRSTAATGP
jgi:hypothetical protein